MTGPTGPAGPVSSEGATGPPGAVGSQGSMGKGGVAGGQGAVGPSGTTGPTGATGASPQGATGPKGSGLSTVIYSIQGTGSAQSVSSGATGPTGVAFTGWGGLVLADIGGITLDPSTTYFTVPNSGLYHCICDTMTYTTDTTFTTTCSMYMLNTYDTYLHGYMKVPGSTGAYGTAFTSESVMPLSANDTVTVYVNQTTGSSLNVGYDGTNVPTFTIRQIG